MTGDFFYEIMHRFCVSHTRDFLKIFYNPKNKKNTDTIDRDWWIWFYWVFIHGIKIFYMRIRFCLLRLNFVMTVLWQYSYWRGLHSSLSIRVFSLLFCFLINIGIMSHEIANLGNSFSQILHFSSYHLLIAQCHLHIIPLQYMSWRVSCF